jgi:hypothetical protein
MRKLAAIAALSAAAAAGGLVAASTVGADSGATESTGYIKAPTTSYTSPSNQSMPVHYNLKPGTPVHVRCWTEGQDINGQHNWLRIGIDGNLGFVHRDTIAPGTGDIPHC